MSDNSEYEQALAMLERTMAHRKLFGPPPVIPGQLNDGK
jgi:hypothetical protein